jgi:hypothetical protein
MDRYPLRDPLTAAVIPAYPFSTLSSSGRESCARGIAFKLHRPSMDSPFWVSSWMIPVPEKEAVAPW